MSYCKWRLQKKITHDSLKADYSTFCKLLADNLGLTEDVFNALKDVSSFLNKKYDVVDALGRLSVSLRDVQENTHENYTKCLQAIQAVNNISDLESDVGVSNAYTLNVDTQQTTKKISRCCGNEPPNQSMIELLKTGGYAAAKWALQGFKIVTQEQQNARLDKCEECDSLYVPDARCTECGCYVKVKAWMATEDCPKGKWDALS
jgi:hypothetical protein